MKSFAQNYGRKGKEKETAEYLHRCHDRRIVIDEIEFKVIHRNASRRQQEDTIHTLSLPSTFWKHKTSPIDPPLSGFIPVADNDGINDDLSDEESSIQLLETNVHLSQGLQGDSSTIKDQDLMMSTTTMHSGNLFLTTSSQQKRMAEMATIANDPEMSAYMLRMFNETLRGMTEMMVAKHSKPADFQGDIVSSLIPIDKRRKCVRIKRGGEYNKTPASLKQHSTTISFSESSIVVCSENSDEEEHSSQDL
jgi:hypothetical protein